MTGTYPPGYNAPSSGGGYGGGKKPTFYDDMMADLKDTIGKGDNDAAYKFVGAAADALKQGYITKDEYNSIQTTARGAGNVSAASSAGNKQYDSGISSDYVRQLKERGLLK